MQYITREDDISILPLSNRLANCLRRSKIHTVGDMMDYPQQNDWAGIPNMGKKSIEEVCQWIERLISGTEDYKLIASDEKPSPKLPDVINEDELQGLQIKDMPLSIRAKNALLSAEYKYAFQLVGKSEEELLQIRNIGIGSAKEIIDKVAALVIRFSDIATDSGIKEASENSAEEKNFFDLSQELNASLGGNSSEYLRILFEIRTSHPTAQGENLFYLLYESGFVRHTLKEKILTVVEAFEEGCSRKHIMEQLPHHLDNTTIIEEVLIELENDGLIVCREASVLRQYPSVISYVQSIANDKIRDMMLGHLQGETLAELGKRHGNITRERVRQIIDKQLKIMKGHHLRFAEDKYRYIFENYYFSSTDFFLAFEEPQTTFCYLDMSATTNRNDRKDIEAILEDNNISIAMRKQAERAIFKQYVLVDGVRVKKERHKLAYHYIRTKCREITKYEDFLNGYHEWLKALSLPNETDFYIDSRTYENKLNAAEYVLWNQWKRFRFYNISNREYAPLLTELDLAQYENIEISALKLFREHAELMQEYDIRDEYELHNLLKKIWPADDASVIFRKMPTIEVGIANRDDQVRTLLLQYAPISAEELSHKYEEEFGVKAGTVLGSYMKNFDAFYFDGIYSIDAKDLPRKQFVRMKEILEKDFYSIAEVKRLYLHEFPRSNAGQINPYTLKTLGFRVYSGYMVKNSYSCAADYFNFLLTSTDIIDARNFDKNIFSVQAYAGELRRLKSERKLVEYAPRQYISSRRLNECGIFDNDLEDYCKAVYHFVDSGAFFTITSIRDDGFSHQLDALGFDEWFYGSLLLNTDSFFSCQRIGGTRLFMKGKSDALFLDMLYWLIEQNEKIDIFDLVDLLESKYGINLPKEKLIEFIRETDMYYDTIMEAVYIDYETYFEEV